METKNNNSKEALNSFRKLNHKYKKHKEYKLRNNIVNQDNTRSKTHKLIRVEKELQNLFSEGKYIEVITKVNSIEKLLDVKFLDFLYFNNKISCLMYLGLSYCQLGEYEKAENSFMKLSAKYTSLINAVRQWKHLTKVPIDKIHSEVMQAGYSYLKLQLDYFNIENSCKYFSNLAFTYYKLEKYNLAISYYKRALKVYYRTKENDNKLKDNEMQLHIGIAEAQYKYYRHCYRFKWLKKYNKIPLDIRSQYQKTISMLMNMKTSFNVLLSLGKMYYFLGDYDKSISYLQKAIELHTENKEKYEIYAFDWLSRIAFKTKKYQLAVEYYQKIIDALVKVPIENNSTIHPRPELYKMFKYLNLNKEETLKHDVHYINKSIWGGIFAGIILESAEILSNYYSTPINIVISMVLIVLIISFIYINLIK